MFFLTEWQWGVLSPARRLVVWEDSAARWGQRALPVPFLGRLIFGGSLTKIRDSLRRLLHRPTECAARCRAAATPWFMVAMRVLESWRLSQNLRRRHRQAVGLADACSHSPHYIDAMMARNQPTAAQSPKTTSPMKPAARRVRFFRSRKRTTSPRTPETDRFVACIHGSTYGG